MPIVIKSDAPADEYLHARVFEVTKCDDPTCECQPGPPIHVVFVRPLTLEDRWLYIGHIVGEATAEELEQYGTDHWNRALLSAALPGVSFVVNGEPLVMSRVYCGLATVAGIPWQEDHNANAAWAEVCQGLITQMPPNVIVAMHKLDPDELAALREQMQPVVQEKWLALQGIVGAEEAG